MQLHEVIAHIQQRWPQAARCQLDDTSAAGELACDREALAELCGWLFLDCGFSFAGLVVEEGKCEWQLRYMFYGNREAGRLQIVVRAPLDQKNFPSISRFVHAADWHEREAEDLFGLVFAGHPRLGDFVLHNDAWQESVEPMRRGFDPEKALRQRAPDRDWRPRRIVQEPGAFVMPIGPVYSGVTESAHFLLETVGEDVIRSTPRLFYKWRAIEKLAEGRTAEEVLLLAERFAATNAFAHGLAFCQAVERVTGTTAPARAKVMRVFLAELERLRHHVGAIEGICESTALVVAGSQAAILQEDLLRVTGELTGHRYLFGLLAPGGLLTDLPDAACHQALAQAQRVSAQLDDLERRLRVSSSFLDRLEEVGAITQLNAKVYGLVGPVARASDWVRDLRRVQPYAGYEAFDFDVPREVEGDGYARLRVLFAESRQAVRLMEQAVARLDTVAQVSKPAVSPISKAAEHRTPKQATTFEARDAVDSEVTAPINLRAGAALGWVEAPRGAAFHWVRLEADGRVARWRIMPPSFANWHGFHLAVEKFAFQDFPIILATFDLSVAENDR